MSRRARPGRSRDLIAAILKRGGLSESDFEIGETGAEVQGYVIDRPMRVRDALEPLLAGLGMIAAERAGRVTIVGTEPAALTLLPGDLALPGDGEGLRSDRILEWPPGVARVRFIDGNTDYQTGSAVVRGSGEGGGVDLDFPAVCSQALAKTAAVRVLEVGGQDRLTASLGPLASLRLEPGDGVEMEGDSRTWRVVRLEMGELSSAVLEPVSAVVRDDDDGGPRSREPVTAGGAPFFRIIELPSLPDAESDGRPIAAVAAEPWRPMRVFAGPDATSLRERGLVNQPATVGVLVSPLVRGVRYRWDEVNVLRVRVEGRRPESLSPTAVLAGGNAVAVETAAGWEVVQYRNAELVGDDLWHLSGLLRGQQGTDGPAAAGAASGAVAVFLGAGLERVESPPAERGLPLFWRATRDGAPPGGLNTAEVTFASTGLLNRPWSPAHLRCERLQDGGVELAWVPRSRIDGDRWEGVMESSDTMRFRIRVFDGDLEVRVIETETTAVTYPANAVASDLPDGLANASVAVAQWGSGYGWGVETHASLA